MSQMMSHDSLQTEIADLAADTPGNPYRRFSELTRSQCRDLLIEDLLGLCKTSSWRYRMPGGWISLSLLPWDTERLGVAAGRVNVYCGSAVPPENLSTLNAALAEAIGDSELTYLFARIVEDDAAALQTLHETGFGVDDRLINMACPPGTIPTRHSDSDISVRRGTPDDEAAVRQLAAHSYANRFLSLPGAEPGRVRVLYSDWAANDLLGRVPITLIATDRGHPVGFLSGGKSMTLPNGCVVGFIDLLVVHHEMQRRGIGRALMHEGVSLMARQGVTLVELNVAESNQKAVALYEGLGFTTRLRYADLTLCRTL